MDLAYLNGAGSSSGNSDATPPLAVEWQQGGEQSNSDTNGIYSMMNQVIDESSVIELEELFNSVVKNLPVDDSSSSNIVVNKGAAKTQLKQMKRKTPATTSDASPETNRKKKKGYYKQKSFVYNGTRCRFPINSDDDLLLDPVIWYRACKDFERASVVSRQKLSKLFKDSLFESNVVHLPLAFEKEKIVVPLYRRFYSSLPLRGVLKLSIYRYVVDLLLASACKKKKVLLEKLSIKDKIAVDKHAQDAIAFLFRHDASSETSAYTNSMSSSISSFEALKNDKISNYFSSKHCIKTLDDNRPKFRGSKNRSHIVRARFKLSDYGREALELKSTTFQPTLHSDLVFYLKNALDMTELVPGFKKDVNYIFAKPLKQGDQFYEDVDEIESVEYRQTLAHWHVDSEDRYLDSIRRKICAHLSGHLSACAVFAIKQKWGHKYFKTKIMELELFLNSDIE
eukprot:g1317.t1